MWFLRLERLRPSVRGVGRGNFILEIFERIISTNYINFFPGKNPNFVCVLLIYISGLMAEHLYNFSFRRYDGDDTFCLHSSVWIEFRVFNANPPVRKLNTATSVNKRNVSCFPNCR